MLLTLFLTFIIFIIFEYILYMYKCTETRLASDYISFKFHGKVILHLVWHFGHTFVLRLHSGDAI